MASVVSENPQFFTSTILNWLPILKEDSYKTVITDSLRFLVNEKRIVLYCFVIMPTHIHIIWQMRVGHTSKTVQRDFLKFTGRRILKMITELSPELLSAVTVNAWDRKHQIWERNSLSIDIYSKVVFLQKIKYIHKNPIQPKWGLCRKECDYLYSTAACYQSKKPVWDFVTVFSADAVSRPQE
jgi:putative transposase